MTSFQRRRSGSDAIGPAETRGTRRCRGCVTAPASRRTLKTLRCDHVPPRPIWLVRSDSARAIHAGIQLSRITPGRCWTYRGISRKARPHGAITVVERRRDELYDLRADPTETNLLADDSSQGVAATAADLADATAQVWRQRTVTSFRLPVPHIARALHAYRGSTADANGPVSDRRRPRHRRTLQLGSSDVPRCGPYLVAPNAAAARCW